MQDQLSSQAPADRASSAVTEAYRSLIDQLNAGVFEGDSDGPLRHVNSMMVRMSGYLSEQELLALPRGRLWAQPEARQVFLQSLARDGRVQRFESTLLRKDGSTLPVAVSAVLVMHPEAGSPQAVGIVEDMSEKRRAKQTEEAMRTLATDFSGLTGRALFEAVACHIATSLGVDFCFVGQLDERTASVTSLGGYALGQPMGELVYDLAGTPCDNVMGKDTCVYASDVQQRFPADALLAEMGCQSYVGAPLFGKGHVPLGILVVLHSQPLSQPADVVRLFDIFRHRLEAEVTRSRAEMALVASERELRKTSAAVEQAPSSILITDTEGLIEYANPRFLHETGYELGQIRGRTPRILKSGATTDSDYREMWRALKRGEEWHGEFRNRRDDGTLFWERAVISPVRDALGHITHYVKFGEDITEQKRIAGELERMRLEYLHAQRMESVGRLAGGVAHDFNNMLTIIQMSVRDASEKIQAGEEVLAELNEIHAAAARSAELTRQLLAFARKQVAEPKALDLNVAIESLLKMLRRLLGENLHLQWRPTGGLWTVLIDPSQLDQVLANLAVNARDAIADVGTVTIDLSNQSYDEAFCASHPTFEPGDWVQIKVGDDGCGMSADVQAHVFEPFFTTKKEGTGLGLATVYGIVSQNRGFVHLDSTPQQGTTFTICLPRHNASPLAPRLDRPAAVPALGRKTILVVEDEPALLRLTTRFLQNIGYQTLGANSPAEALRLARDHATSLNLLLTDLVMPDRNGRELAKDIVALSPDVKVLLMSGYSADIIEHPATSQPGVEFIQKPFTIEVLSARIAEMLGGARG